MCCRLRGGGSLDLRAPEPRPRPSPPAPLADWPTGLRCARPIKEDDGERGAEEKTERGSERRGEEGPEGGGGWEGAAGAGRGGTTCPGAAGRKRTGIGRLGGRRGGEGRPGNELVRSCCRGRFGPLRSRIGADLKYPPPLPPRVRLLFQGTARALRWLYRKCELRLGPVWVGTRARRPPPPPAPPGFPPREARAVGLGPAGGTRVRESRREARGTAGGKGKGRLRRIRPVHPCTPVPATGRSSGSAGDPVMLQPLKLQLILCRIPPREDCDQSYPLRHAAQPGNNHRISCQYFLTTNMEPEVGVQEKG
ncbi:collagen alpha-1(I) chain-like [Canis lupus dingo]|uniref:collagen alpha-1(I) chain-like n=1 Tax=Canis lupus dingo TaxID=286419 RepID=UPI0020C525B7|nr:collagen alpha-1(I) chain-like [Canis lupus dingo]